MKKQFSPGDIRNLLGISRSAIRYYMDKGLISAQKNEENGYSYYDWCNLEEMLDVTYFRNCMNAEANDIWEITHSTSPKEYHDAYSKQIKQFEENIYRQQIHLEMLYNFNEKIERAMNSQNIIKEITLEEPFWVYYPEMDECPGVRTALFSTSYWGSEYVMENGTLNYKGFVMMTDEKNLAFLDKESSGISARKIPGGRFLYTSLCSDRGLDDPSLVELLTSYIREHQMETSEPIYLWYLLTFRNNGRRCHCYEVFFPIA